MWIHRMVTHAELESAYCPGAIVCHTIEEMRRSFYPAEDLLTRVFVHHSLPATCFQMSLRDTVSPVQPHAETNELD